MKNTTHRVVILKNVNSQLISQAILFLKDGANENETSVMMEAEQIVEKYMDRTLMQKKDISRKKLSLFMSGCAIFCAIGLFLLFYFI